ncbi:hypothetical protein BpHYR1_044186 [Brachionus plicatilis]|uniref:Transmembrane protein n=1 Tax=Brachionus plicatilis TaxID=10195 RepID=A0A3M7PAY6_BRAPC|nr:hypothetical protein BpHYR1_044186 [Brachionus plicatilis]
MTFSFVFKENLKISKTCPYKLFNIWIFINSIQLSLCQLAPPLINVPRKEISAQKIVNKKNLIKKIIYKKCLYYYLGIFIKIFTKISLVIFHPVKDLYKQHRPGVVKLVSIRSFQFRKT